MKTKAYIIVLVVVLITITTSCISRENFFDLANDIINPEIKISYPGGGPGLYFGEVELDSSKDMTITVENSGDTDLIITGIEVTGSAYDEFSVDQVSLVVEVDGITTFKVTFSPSFEGSKDALVTIESNDLSDDKYDIPVIGTAIGSSVSGPVINVSLKNNDVLDLGVIDFGKVENSKKSLPARFTVENSGDADLVIRDIFFDTADFDEFDIDDELTLYTIEAGGSSTFDIVFNPVVDGPKSTTIVIESDALNTQNYSIDVSGNGVLASLPDINVVQQGNDPTLLGISGIESFDFGTVDGALGGFSTGVFIVQNTGMVSLNIINITSSNGAFFYISDPLSVLSFDEGESGTFEVTFDPGSIEPDGPVTAIIRIENDDPDIFERPYTFEVTGTRTKLPVADLKVREGEIIESGPYITPDTGISSLGKVAILTPKPFTFTLENTGTADLFVNPITSSNEGNFMITAVAGGVPSDNLPLTITSSGGSAEIEITFTPTEMGIFSSVITIDSNDPDLNNGFVFTATGESSNKPEIKVYQGGILFDHNAIYDFGEIPVDSSSSPVEFEIRNEGNAPLLIDPIILTGADSLNFELDLTGTASVIAPAASTTFRTIFKPLETGTFKNKSDVVIDSNDPNRKNGFSIQLYGKGQ